MDINVKGGELAARKEASYFICQGLRVIDILTFGRDLENLSGKPLSIPPCPYPPLPPFERGVRERRL